jgi:hypothetical protein
VRVRFPDDPVGLDDARSAFNHYVDAYEALRSVATQLYAGADGNVQLKPYQLSVT